MEIPIAAIRPDAGGGSIIDCHIQPGAARSRVVGGYDGRVKIAVAAPPVDGKANAALRKFLASLLKLPVGRVRLLSGETGRSKKLNLSGVSPESLLDALQRSE